MSVGGESHAGKKQKGSATEGMFTHSRGIGVRETLHLLVGMEGMSVWP